MPGSGAADGADAPLRRAAHGRHGAARGQDRRDGDRRGQDARGHAARVPQRAPRAGHPHRHRQRLPRPARRAVDGTDLPRARPARGRDPARGVLPLRPRLHPARHPPRLAAPVLAPRGLPRGHHLRHQQRVRLRLPSRQHAVLARGDGAARAHLRHRGRGRLHPHRRSADTPHHFGPRRGLHRQVLQDRSRDPQAHACRHHRGGQALRDRGPGRGRLHRGREVARGFPDRAGDLALREASHRREHLRPGPDGGAPPHPPGAQGPRPVQEGRGLRGEGRAGDHRRRVHRPAHAGPALVGRAPPGRGGKRRRQDRIARIRHLPP